LTAEEKDKLQRKTKQQKEEIKEEEIENCETTKKNRKKR
jgi:hypothetical protein